jgi:hypothetical protein
VRDDVREADRWKSSARRWESDIVRKLLRFYVRHVRGRMRWWCRRKNDFFLQSELERESVAADTEEVVQVMERVFQSAMHRCMQAAKRHRNLNLIEYVENIYETEAQTDHMYLSECATHTAGAVIVLCVAWSLTHSFSGAP